MSYGMYDSCQVIPILWILEI